MSGPRERRRDNRVTISARVDLSSESNFFAGVARDISLGGLFVATEMALPIGAEVTVRLTLPGEVLGLRAEVAWVLSGDAGTVGLGLRFLVLPARAKRAIESSIQVRRPIDGSKSKTMSHRFYGCEGPRPMSVFSRLFQKNPDSDRAVLRGREPGEAAPSRPSTRAPRRRRRARPPKPTPRRSTRPKAPDFESPESRAPQARRRANRESSRSPRPSPSCPRAHSVERAARRTRAKPGRAVRSSGYRPTASGEAQPTPARNPAPSSPGSAIPTQLRPAIFWCPAHQTERPRRLHHRVRSQREVPSPVVPPAKSPAGAGPPSGASTVPAVPPARRQLDSKPDFDRGARPGFGAILEPTPSPAVSPAAKPLAPAPDALDVFVAMAGDDMRPVRDLMIGIEWGEPLGAHLTPYGPALSSLVGVARQMDLDDLAKALGELGDSLATARADAAGVIETASRANILSAYAKVAILLPAAFALEVKRLGAKR